MKYYILFSILWLIYSCNSHNDIFYDLTSSKELKSDKILYETSEAGILTQLQIEDSLLIAIDELGEKKFFVIDLISGEEVIRFGEKGRGPNEFYSPKFIANDKIVNKNSSFTTIYDNNSMRFSHINFKKLASDSSYKILSDNFPAKIIGSTNLNLIKNKIIGKSSSSEESGMFFIYDIHHEKHIWADYYPIFENIKSGMRNYIYNVNLAANGNKNRIICGMTFMDIISVFDTTGHLIKSYQFSENTIPDIDPVSKMIKSKSSVYFPRTFSTPDYCYFLRLGYNANDTIARKNGTILIKLNWEGDIVNSYKLDKYLYGFCIDEKKNKLLGIISEDSDTFKIIEYDL